MATCSPADLITESACFCGLDNRALQLVQLALLCKLWQFNDPMAQCNVDSLMASAKCFNCLTSREIQSVQTQLLCEILHSGGGSGTTCTLCGDADPVDTPENCDCAIYYRKDTGNFWYWDADLVQWVLFLGG